MYLFLCCVSCGFASNLWLGTCNGAQADQENLAKFCNMLFASTSYIYLYECIRFHISGIRYVFRVMWNIKFKT